MILDTTTPTTTPPDLGSIAIQDGMSQSVSAAYLLQVYTNTVLQTPTITLAPQVDTDSNSTVVEDLPVHQATALANARYYLDTINPKLMAVTSQIIGYGNKYTSYYDTLVDLANNLTEGDNADQLVDGLNSLLKKANSCKSQADQVSSMLASFLSLITIDAKNFATDASHVQTAIQVEGQEVAELQAQIDSINKGMTKDIGVMAVGGAADLIGLTSILIGVLGSVESGGTTIVLVVFGLACLTAGSVVAASAFADYEDQRDNYKTLYAELSNEQQIYAVTQQAATTIDSLKTATEDAVTAITVLQDAWSSLEKDLQQVIDAVQRAPQDTGIWLINDITDAYQEWQQTVSVATNIQKNAVLPVQTETA